MSTKPFTEHPEFMRVSRMVSDAMTDIAHRLDCADLDIFEAQANRAADDLTKLILRAYDFKRT